MACEAECEAKCEAECDLCMESMKDRGCVTLKCAHKMCPECFAKHARINHTCPFCRDEFAPKIESKGKQSIPYEQIEDIIIEHILSDRDFYYGINRRINWEIESRKQVAILRTAVGNMCAEAMMCVARWYDAREH